MELGFLKRASLTRNPLAQRLFKLMEDKRTNLCVAADLTSQQKLLQLADELGPSIAVFKLHVDILSDFTPDLGEKLTAIARKHHFLIFEDRKFADIGQTVLFQCSGGLYRISEWADLITAHSIPGSGILTGLKEGCSKREMGVLLLAEMSSRGSLAKGAYTKKTVQMAEENSDFVLGFICQKKLSEQPGLIHFTPGVKFHKGKDSLGQRYRTVEEVLRKNNTDLIIVGRDITHASSPREQAEIYRETAWKISAEIRG